MQNNTLKKIIFALFFASGASGLIYEVVWLRMLTRIMGVTTYATSIILAAFMTGLAIGSMFLGKYIDNRRNLLRIYAWLELLIGITALITPLLLGISVPLYKQVYLLSNNNTGIIVIVRIFVSFFCILIPTILMGGTLPVLTAFMVRKEKKFGKYLSLLYGLNTLGAVTGVILSGFFTIGSIGEWNTIFIGILINLSVSAAAFKLSNKEVKDPETVKDISAVQVRQAEMPISPYPDYVRKIVLFSIFISGFTALSYEVIWTRQLILFLKTSIYAFSGMLAVFLTGIALGSIFINKYVDRLKAPLVILGIIEMIIGVISIINLYLFPILDTNVFSRLSAAIILILPLTFLFGVIFPVASFSYAENYKKTGSSVGTLYSFNTIGNVAGSLITGFLLMALLGSSRTVILLSLLNVATGILLLWLEPSLARKFKIAYLAAIPLVLLSVLGFKGKDPFLNVIENRITKGAANYKIFLNKETIEGTITSYERNDFKGLMINGIDMTHLCTETKLMAHLPIILAGNPKNVLIICFGMGTAVKSACIYDNLNIISVELVSETYRCFKYYHKNAEEILNKANYRHIVGDGRNFLLLSDEKYDVITIDPSPPIYSAGTVNLYTREFLMLCREHLNPGGVMCLWFPGGTINDDILISKTFYSVFPNSTLWSGPHQWGFYLIGMPGNSEPDKIKIEKAFRNKKLPEDLAEYDKSCVTSSHLIDLLKYRKEQIKEITKDAGIMTDNYPYTEFPLWRD